MKRIIIATIVSLGLAATAFAKEIDFKGCTTDHIKAVLAVDVNDQASQEVVDHIAKAFKNAASGLTFEQLAGHEGFVAFATALTDEDKAAIDGLVPPAATGECK